MCFFMPRLKIKHVDVKSCFANVRCPFTWYILEERTRELKTGYTIMEILINKKVIGLVSVKK